MDYWPPDPNVDGGNDPDDGDLPSRSGADWSGPGLDGKLGCFFEYFGAVNLAYVVPDSYADNIEITAEFVMHLANIVAYLGV